MIEEPTAERQQGWLGWVAWLLAGFLGVIVFVPSDGRIAVPLHAGLEALLGRAAFVLPLGLALFGTLVLVRRVQPTVRVPVRRLAGVVAMCIAVLAIEHLLPRSPMDAGTGLLGQKLSALLLDLLGGPATAFVLTVLLGLGVGLTFDLKPALRLRRATRQIGAESQAESAS